MNRRTIAGLLGLAVLAIACGPGNASPAPEQPNLCPIAYVEDAEPLPYVELLVEVTDEAGIPQTWPVTETILFATTNPDGDVEFCDSEGNAGAGPAVSPQIAPYGPVKVDWHEPVTGAAIKIDAAGLPAGWSVDCTVRRPASRGGGGDYQFAVAPNDPDLPGTFNLTVTCKAW